MASRVVRSTLLIAGVPLALSAPLAAQQQRAACPAGDSPVPSIGIVGLSCSDCSARTVDGVELWSFEREPQIITVDPRAPGAGTLKAGDVIVAIDGLLITTPRGGERFSRVAAGERVKLRVRRSGVVRELELEAYGYCRGQSGTGSGRVVGPTGSLPSLDLPEPLPQLLPGGSLGIGIACQCTVQAKAGEPARWRFQQAPQVEGVDPDGPAAAAGLQPGDVLLEIDGKSLLTDAGGDAYSAVRPGQVVRVTVKRAGHTRTLTLTAGRR